MTTVSRLGGISASTAKYQSRYQSGRGLGLGDARVGRPCRAPAARPPRPGATMPPTIATPNTTSRHAASGQKGTPSFSERLRTSRGRSSDRPARRASGGSEMPWRMTSMRCSPRNAKIIAGMRKTWIAKKRLSVAPPTVSPPRMKRAMYSPIDRRAPRLLGADHDRPRRVLIPAQQLPGEPHAEREEQEQHAGHPVHLARELVRAGEEHLRHVQAHHEHHRRRAVVVQAAQEAAEGRLVGDEEQRVVRLRRGRDVREGQRHAA